MPSKKGTKTPKLKKTTTTKKAFDLSRDSVYTADPISDLRICGGDGALPEDQAGDLDTQPGPDVSVRDQRRLARPIRPEFSANIRRHGVKTPVIIAKIGDVATVIDGKSRVRAARAENRRRLREGDPRPMIKIRCVMQRDTSPAAIMATMISSNNAREDDDLADRIEKLKVYLAEGASEADAAIEFAVKQSTIRNWLEYDDHATDELKTAVKERGVKASSAMELAKIKDPDQQRATLSKVEAGHGSGQQSARAVRALRFDQNGKVHASDRKSQKLLLNHVDGMMRSKEWYERYENDDLGNHQEFWHGVKAALALVTGKGDVDPKLVDAMTKARSAKTSNE